MGTFDPWEGNTLGSVTAASPSDAAAAITAGQSATGLSDADVWSGNTLGSVNATGQAGGNSLASALKGLKSSTDSSSSSGSTSKTAAPLYTPQSNSSYHAGSGGMQMLQSIMQTREQLRNSLLQSAMGGQNSGQVITPQTKRTAGLLGF